MNSEIEFKKWTAVLLTAITLIAGSLHFNAKLDVLLDDAIQICHAIEENAPDAPEVTNGPS